jgi:glycosyltransferase involved in cell wall biosynthesis
MNFDHSVLVQGGEGPMSAIWESLGASVAHLNSLHYNRVRLKKIIQEYLNGKQYDLVIYWSTIRLASVLASLKNTTNSVKIYLGNPSRYSNLTLFLEKAIERVYGRPKEVRLMACSDYVANSFKKLSYFNTFPMEVSYNPIETLQKNPKKLFLNRETFEVGMLARLDPIKNHALLIGAFSKVLKSFPNMRLNLVGDGTVRASLESLVKSCEIQGKVKFHGDIENVYDYLQTWDTFIYATTEKEGLGSAVLEAMANGLPCLLPNLPMMKELAPMGVDVNWFDTYDEASLVSKWITMFNNPDQFPNMSESVFRHSQNFSAKRFVNDYIKING